ncbi:MAG: S1C family serine protease [Treponema sp.]|jgi:S1-C subfamily serine protease|nr:S1C family serine protease [Treponema sp.]
MKTFVKLAVCAAVSIASCAGAAQKLSPPKSTSEYRLSDIEKNIEGDPARAIYLISIYEKLYGSESRHAQEFTGETEEKLEQYRSASIEKMRSAQMLALEEKRYDDAASLSRSLSALGISVEKTGAESEIVLAEARNALEADEYLKAFLLALRSHQMNALSFGDIRPFLEKAVEQKQRRTAAFFLDAAEKAGDGSIPDEIRAYAAGADTVSDMVKGVATVIVDRGFRAEKGLAYRDRVLGSAFFVDSSGLLITNYHVIASEVDPTYEGYSRAFIRMGDSSSPQIRARVIGWDKAMDLALIKADYKPEYVFPIVDRVIPKTGDTVFAIGSPGGLEKTVTQGIVSALGRRFLQIGDVIQIDAAVNHGNSGGPVIDKDGRLVGIVFAGIEQFQGLNFAVPAERLAAALPAMLNGGRAERPWIGLIVAESGTTADPRAEIIYAAPFTPAFELQLKEGSLIEKINGQKISAAQGALIPALQDVLFPTRPGELVTLELRDEENISSVVLMTAARPDLPLADAAERDRKERMAAPLYGMILAPTTGNSLSSSYVIKKIIRGSIADEAGLSEKDPVSIKSFRVMKDAGYALMDISVKRRRMGYLETSMRLPAALDSPDTL